MNDLSIVDDMPMISAYTADDAIKDGGLLDLTPQTDILPIHQIFSMDSYLQNYGKILGRKAIHALAPLHVPNRDPLPDFSAVPDHRQPFPAQSHVIAASIKMFDKVGNGFIVGEMGTGKTLLGMLAVHYHAMRSRKQGGSGGNYRALILCPDHLIGKWKREIEDTIPDATVTRFGPQGSSEEEVAKPPKGARRKKGEPKPEPNSKATLRDVIALLEKSDGDRWSKPDGAEWFVLGRNQAKWLSDWTGMADSRPGFSAVEGKLREIATTALIGKDNNGDPVTETTYHIPMPKPPVAPLHCISSKAVAIEHQSVLDLRGYPTYDKKGNPIRKAIYGRLHYCPSCGQNITDKKGVPLSAKDLQSGTSKSTAKNCKGVYLQMLAAPADKKRSHGLDRIPIPAELYGLNDKIGWK